MTTNAGDTMGAGKKTKRVKTARTTETATALAKLTESGALGVVPFQALAMRFDCDIADVQDQLDNFRDNAEALAVAAGMSGQARVDAYSAGYAAELARRRASGFSVRGEASR